MSSPNRNAPITIRRVLGNREAIGAVLSDNNGNALNLAGKTIVFRMVNVKTETVKVNNASATIDDAATGKVSYTPTADDVDTAGTYACYFIDDAAIDRRFPYDGASVLLRIISETETA